MIPWVSVEWVGMVEWMVRMRLLCVQRRLVAILGLAGKEGLPRIHYASTTEHVALSRSVYPAGSVNCQWEVVPADAHTISFPES
jgi:hypothetical protein